MSSLYDFSQPILPQFAQVPIPFIVSVDYIVWVSHAIMIASTSVAFWDWVICFPQEYTKIWRAEKRNFSWALYIFNRYWLFVSCALALWTWLGGWDFETCQKRYRWGPGIVAWTELSAEVVIVSRTYAVWKRSPYILAVGIICLSGYTAYVIYAIKTAFSSVPSFRNIGPCIAQNNPGSKVGILFFALPMAIDVIFTSLMLYKLIPMRRQMSQASDILMKLFREGALYAILLSAVNATNTALMASNLSSNAMMVGVSFVLSGILTSRMLLSLKSGNSTDNTSYQRSGGNRSEGLTKFANMQTSTMPGVTVHEIRSTAVDIDAARTTYDPEHYELEEKQKHFGKV